MDELVTDPRKPPLPFGLSSAGSLRQQLEDILNPLHAGHITGAQAAERLIVALLGALGGDERAQGEK